MALEEPPDSAEFFAGLQGGRATTSSQVLVEEMEEGEEGQRMSFVEEEDYSVDQSPLEALEVVEQLQTKLRFTLRQTGVDSDFTRNFCVDMGGWSLCLAVLEGEVHEHCQEQTR